MQPLIVLGAVWLVNYENCEINHVLIGMRPEMAVKPGFIK